MLRRHLPALLVAGCASPQAATPLRVSTASGLHARAAMKGLAFGTAVTARQLAEPDLVAAIRADCGLLVPEYEQKWRIIEPEPGRRSFAGPDMIARFARDSGMGLRGHTLLWHESEPGWAGELSAPALAEAADRHVAVTAAHFHGRITTWDVLNEAIHLADARPDWLRRTRLLRLLGPDYIPRAFTLARAADPHRAARLQ